MIPVLVENVIFCTRFDVFTVVCMRWNGENEGFPRPGTDDLVLSRVFTTPTSEQRLAEYPFQDDQAAY